MLNEFEIVVLGLESRTDRWERCKEIFEANGIKRVTHFATQKGEDLFRHATQDYLRMLSLKKGKNIMFFEDDFELVNGWEEVLERAWHDLPKDYDMLYLGANLQDKAIRVTDNLVRVKDAWMLHAVIMNRKFIDWVLKVYDINRRVVMDEWMRIIAKERKFYMTYPMISYQRSGYSDFVKKEIEYNIFDNKYYKKL